MWSARPRLAWLAACLGLCASVIGFGNRAQAQGLLLPPSFAPLPPLPDQAGTYKINTGPATPVMTLPDGATIDGVVDPSGQVAVFTFNSIRLDASSTVVAQGSRAVALLSRTDITLNGAQISVNGKAGSPGSPGTMGGAGGTGLGPGVGGSLGGAGGGGGHGGNGGLGGGGFQIALGNGQFAFPGSGALPTSPGGASYGGLTSPFVGGSNGGYGLFGAFAGGGGGGAIELGALGNIVVNNPFTTISADGGAGAPGAGGGSGGSISLLARSLTGSAFQVSATGGNGGAATGAGGPGGFQIGAGGGGGGGIIIYETDDGIAKGWDASGGTGLVDGQSGLVFNLVVLEPSGLVLATIASLAGLGYGLTRGRSSRRSAPAT
jgi:hypothetical protein